MLRVLVVDDSAVMRRMLTAGLARAHDIHVIEAVDPYDARDKVLRFAPDVVTLDIEMPRMDGLTFLARLMEYHPLPVVVVSSLTPKNSEAALRALELGACDVIAKPGAPADVPAMARQLLRAVRAAATANLHCLVDTTGDGPIAVADAVPHGVGVAALRSVIAVGASTGGPVAIEQLLTGLPADVPGIVIVQHMPVGFTAAFARRLNERCELDVREADDGMPVEPGLALVAPAGRHMLLRRRGAGLQVAVRDGPPVHFQRPAVDVLFHSVAQLAGPRAIGVLLTGMGSDGASGMRALRDVGAHTIAQDEATSVVFSMPAEAIRFEGACSVLPLPRIAAAIVSAVNGPDPLLAASQPGAHL